MKQVRVGDITIDAVIEREGPWRRPQDFFPAYDEATFKRHLPTMEPEVFDAALGMMVITYQTFVVRTPRHTILVDTCTGEDKGHPPPSPRVDWDPKQAAVSRRKFLSTVAETDTLILPIHFQTPTAGLVTADGDRFNYRFKRE